jgi:glutamate synthase (NADPH/NADH) small chain
MKKIPRTPVRELDPSYRITNFEEVSLGYNMEEAMLEASRCLECKKPMCVDGCPVAISVPNFIHHIKAGDFKSAAEVIAQASALPAVCGRVCPQETQCEGRCILGVKQEPVSIGKLERFIGDWSRENNISLQTPIVPNGIKVAIIGSGPAGLACAGDLARMGYEVTIYEALHKPGGVLEYGIPSFRLPKETVVRHEIGNIVKMGVTIENNVIIGRTLTIDQLFEDENFKAVFIGSGAGLPKFMGIPGENLNGVLSSNEFLTRTNLMEAHHDDTDTPLKLGKKVAVIGGGNVAMDAARTARRLGSEVHIVYRRSKTELPARVEEVHHAEQEGIIFDILTNPTEILGHENGWVKALKCVKMELGEPDESGRRAPQVIEGSEFTLEVETVIMALGTSPNPLITSTTNGLELNRRRCILIEEETGKTSRDGVYAGGDAVTGAATVILAMGAGRKAAKAIDRFLSNPANE